MSIEKDGPGIYHQNVAEAYRQERQNIIETKGQQVKSESPQEVFLVTYNDKGGVVQYQEIVHGDIKEFYEMNRESLDKMEKEGGSWHDARLTEDEEKYYEMELYEIPAIQDKIEQLTQEFEESPHLKDESRLEDLQYQIDQWQLIKKFPTVAMLALREKFKHGNEEEEEEERDSIFSDTSFDPRRILEESSLEFSSDEERREFFKQLVEFELESLLPGSLEEDDYYEGNPDLARGGIIGTLQIRATENIYKIRLLKKELIEQEKRIKEEITKREQLVPQIKESLQCIRKLTNGQ